MALTASRSPPLATERSPFGLGFEGSSYVNAARSILAATTRNLMKQSFEQLSYVRGISNQDEPDEVLGGSQDCALSRQLIEGR